MSWLFSRVLVEEYSQGISSDGQTKAIGNGQVPRVAETAFKLLLERLKK